MADAGETPELRAMIERSSLGTPGARQLRARIPQSQVELVGQIIRHREDLAACRGAGDRHGALMALAGLAGAYHALGRDEEAMGLAADPTTIPGGDTAWARAALATVNLALGRAADANGLYQDMLAKCVEAGDREGMAHALVGQANALQAMGHDREARSLRERASRLTAQLETAAQPPRAEPNSQRRPGRPSSVARRFFPRPSSARSKMAVYLGLVEDERYDDEDYDPYDEYPDAVTDAPEGQARKENTGSDLDSGWQPIQRRGSARPVDLADVITLHPRTYDEAPVIGEHLRNGKQVIIDVTEMLPSDAKRLVDFAAGLTFGLHGSLDRVTNRVFLLCPADVEVTVDVAATTEDEIQPKVTMEDEAQALKRQSSGRG